MINRKIYGKAILEKNRFFIFNITIGHQIPTFVFHILDLNFKKSVLILRYSENTSNLNFLFFFFVRINDFYKYNLFSW